MTISITNIRDQRLVVSNSVLEKKLRKLDTLSRYISARESVDNFSAKIDKEKFKIKKLTSQIKSNKTLEKSLQESLEIIKDTSSKRRRVRKSAAKKLEGLLKEYNMENKEDLQSLCETKIAGFKLKNSNDLLLLENIKVGLLSLENELERSKSICQRISEKYLIRADEQSSSKESLKRQMARLFGNIIELQRELDKIESKNRKPLILREPVVGKLDATTDSLFTRIMNFLASIFNSLSKARI